MKSHALGKGLSALIPEKGSVVNQETTSQLSVEEIRNNRFQPRQDYDPQKLAELKSSIQQKGILQPILVRPVDQGFEVVAGERRLRAARDLGLASVPVMVKEITDQEAMVLALIENIQRQELNAIEEAEAFKRLGDDFGYSQEEVAQSVGRDRSTIANLLRLLKLPSEIQDFVRRGALSMGHARALLAVEDSKEQKNLAQAAISKGLSVRELERLVKKHQQVPKKTNDILRDPAITTLEEQLQRVLGTKCRILAKNKKKGKIVIEYYSMDDFNRVIKGFIQ